MTIALLPGTNWVPRGARRPEKQMSGRTDQVKGRVKEAAGVLVGDKKLEREGKVDRAAGNIKEKAANVADRVKETTEEAVEKVKSTINRKS